MDTNLTVLLNELKFAPDSEQEYVGKDILFKISLGDVNLSSKVIPNCPNPLKWDKENSFKFYKSKEQEIKVKLLFNTQEEGQSDTASAIIQLKDIVSNKENSKTVSLMNKATQKIGDLTLQFELDDKKDLKSQDKSNADTQVITRQQIQEKQKEIDMKLSQITSDIKIQATSQELQNLLNTVLLEGMKQVENQKSENMIRDLGLFLINYDKERNGGGVGGAGGNEKPKDKI